MPDDAVTILKVVVARMRVAYEQEGVPTKDRYPDLRVSQYKTQTAAVLPKLKASGMQCKGLAKIMPRVFEALMNAEDPGHRRVLRGLRAIRETNCIYD